MTLLEIVENMMGQRAAWVGKVFLNDAARLVQPLSVTAISDELVEIRPATPPASRHWADDVRMVLRAQDCYGEPTPQQDAVRVQSATLAAVHSEAGYRWRWYEALINRRAQNPRAFIDDKTERWTVWEIDRYQRLQAHFLPVFDATTTEEARRRLETAEAQVAVLEGGRGR